VPGLENSKADGVVRFLRVPAIRCAESADLTNQLDGLLIRKRLQASDKIEQLKVQFLNLYKTIERDPALLFHKCETITQLEGIRHQLASTSQGLDFLIVEMKEIWGRATSFGRLSIEDGIMMLACCGFGNDTARMLYRDVMRTLDYATEGESLNDIMSRIRPGTAADESTERSSAKEIDWSALRKRLLSRTTEELISSLSARRLLVKRAEKLEAETRSGTAAIPDTSDRFSRAETIYERRLYRALGMLFALRGAASHGMKGRELPGLPE